MTSGVELRHVDDDAGIGLLVPRGERCARASAAARDC
jgi:hypothetical protein